MSRGRRPSVERSRPTSLYSGGPRVLDPLPGPTHSRSLVKPAGESARMPSATSVTDEHRNRILAALPPPDRERLVGSIGLVSLESTHVLFQPGGPIDAVYFPLGGVIPLITALQDGNIVEVATIGNEGIV